MNRIVLLLILAHASFRYVGAACTFPTNLIGQWTSLSYGTLTFTSSSFSGFTSAISAGTLTFTCEISSGTQYVAKSSVTLFAGFTINKFLCLQIEVVSSVSYKMTLLGNKEDITNIRVYTSQSDTITLTQACTTTDSRSPGEFELLILANSITSAIQTCPDDFLFNFNVTMGTDCDNNTLDGTISNTLWFKYSSCGTSVAFSAGGHLNCLYNVTDGESYLLTYNNDTTTDETTKYRFTCFAYARSGGVIYATEHPITCQTTQSSVSVTSPGITYIMAEIGYVAPTVAVETAEETDNTVLIAVLTTVFIVIIITGIIIAVVCYMKVCKRKPRPPTPEPPPKKKKKKRKPRLAVVNEYLPQKSPKIHRDKGVEIINELTKNRAALRMDFSKEPMKPKWQKKWETDLRPPTPSSLMSSRKFPSADGLSTLTGFSSSRESIPATMEDEVTVIKRLVKRADVADKVDDATSGTDASKPSEAVKVDGDQSAADVKPLPKDEHEPTVASIDETILTPKMARPPSLQSTSTQTEIKHDDFSSRKEASYRLDLSGKNFTPRKLQTVPETGQEYEDNPYRVSDNSSLITDTGTFTTLNTGNSTLTARGIRLKEDDNTTIGNFSYLSVSTSAIFDADDKFLQGNSKETDSVFIRGASLFPPGLKRSKSLDPNRFTEAQIKVDESQKGSNSYYNSRSKQSLSVGLNNKALARDGTKTSSVPGMTRKRTERQQKIGDWKCEWEHKERPRSARVLVRRLSCHRITRPRTASPRCKFRNKVDSANYSSPDCSDDEVSKVFESRHVRTPDDHHEQTISLTKDHQKRPTSPMSVQSIHSILRQDPSLKDGQPQPTRNKRCQTDGYLFFFDDPVAITDDGLGTNVKDMRILVGNTGSFDLEGSSGVLLERPPTPYPRSSNLPTKFDWKEEMVEPSRQNNDIDSTAPDISRPSTPYPRASSSGADDKSCIRSDMGSMASIGNTDVPLPNLDMTRSVSDLSGRVFTFGTAQSRANTDFNFVDDRPVSVLSRARTELARSHLKVDYMYDDVSLYSELFYPDSWMEDKQEEQTEEYWRHGSAIWTKHRKSRKHWFTETFPSGSS